MGNAAMRWHRGIPHTALPIPPHSNELLARYNAERPEAPGDLHRRNGTPATVLKPGLLAKLRGRLRDPPSGGGSRRRSPHGARSPERPWPHDPRDLSRGSGATSSRQVDGAVTGAFLYLDLDLHRRPK